MEIYELTALEIRNQFLSGELTSEEIVSSIFERIEKLDKKINSFVHLRKEKALSEAKALDKKKKEGKKLGKLAGIPLAIKDNMLSLGDKSSSCSKILENYIAIYDSTVVKNLKNEDAIIVGTTNMDEFAMGSTTTTSYFGKTFNPWSLEHTPGGSSGGSAAAVSANMVPISLGSDTGGSIRQPAAFCGIIGIKPTYGRVSRYGLMAFASSMDQIGPFANTLEDISLVLSVISGYDENDSTSAKKEVPDYLSFLNQDIKGLKIGVPEEYFVSGIQEDVKLIIEESIEKLKTLGVEIKKISLPHTKYSVPTYYVIAPAEASSNLARFDGVRYGERSTKSNSIDDLYFNSRTEGMGDEVKRRIMIGTYVLSAGFYDAYFKKAQKVRRLIKQDFEKAFETVDVILTPVSPKKAFKLSDKKTPVELYLEDIFTISANLAGIPALSMPAGMSDGLPVGIQFLGKAFDEGILLKVASSFEKVRGPFNGPKMNEI